MSKASCLTQYLKERREKLKKTQSWIAERIGVSREFYALIESGKKLLPWGRVDRLAKVLDVEPVKIVELLKVDHSCRMIARRVNPVTFSTRKITKGPLDGRD